MVEEIYGLVTFKSTNYALQGEQIFKDNKFTFKTIPTPREVSTSCGLSLLFLVNDIEKIKELIDKGYINIDGLYRYTKSNDGSKAEKVLWLRRYYGEYNKTDR